MVNFRISVRARITYTGTGRFKVIFKAIDFGLGQLIFSLRIWFRSGVRAS